MSYRAVLIILTTLYITALVFIYLKTEFLPFDHLYLIPPIVLLIPNVLISLTSKNTVIQYFIKYLLSGHSKRIIAVLKNIITV